MHKNNPKNSATITVDNETKTMQEWEEVTGLPYETIKSRRRRTKQGYADYSARQQVGLDKIPKAANLARYPKSHKSPKKNADRELDMFLLRLIFSRERLI